jgi:acetyl esterase/lipase
MYLQDAVNYTASTQLGVNAPWASPYAQVTVVSGSMVYPGLSDLSPAGNMIASAAATGGGATYRAFDTTATSGTVYFSLLVKCTAAVSSSSYYTLGLLPSTTTTPGGRTADPLVLMVKSATGGYNLGVGSANASAAVYASAALALNVTNLVVLKYDFSSKVASLYLNPAPGAAEPGTPDATVTGTTTFSDIKHVYIRTPGGSGSWNYDTMRIASTWAEVTPSSVQVSAANSTATASPASLMADGIASSTITITAKDSSNNPLSGIPGAAVVVSATGTGNLLTQPASATDVNGQTTATLKSTNAEAKTISVTISGTAITSQPTVTFTNPPANQPPAIASDGQPQGQSVVVGAAVSFSVTAGGTAPLSYQWRKNLAPLAAGTNATVTLTNVAIADHGSYDVVVTNAYGSTTSAVAVLTVSAPPVTISATSWATIRSGLNFYTDIDEAAAGYVLTKYSANIDPATGSTGAAKSYLQFDFAGQTPNVNSPLAFAFSRYSNSGAQNVTLWALNQSFPSMSTNLTWAAAQANDISNNSMLTNGLLTATALTNFVVSGSSGSTTITLLPPWGQFILANKLVLAFTANDDAGNNANGFRLLLTNSAQAASLTFSVLTEQPPMISAGGQPQTQTVETGASVNFSVAALGSLPMSYQWYFNTNTPLSAGTNAVLTLPSVTTNDAGAYHVVITNSYGTYTSAFASLLVNPPQAPLITQDPPSQSVTEGSPVSFSVTATGSLPLAYQWYEVVGGVTSLLTGQTNANYSLGITTTNDNGEGFYVVVANAFGLATSELATLQVLPNTAPPAIASQPLSQTVQPGANATFSVVVSGATPLSYQWFFNLTNFIANATNASLNLTSVSTADQGSYDVVATNAYGAITSLVATLTVNTNASSINPLDFINPRFSTVDKTTGITYTPNGYPSASALDLYQPHGDTNTQRPVIVWIHGGSLKTGTDRTQSYIVTYCNDFAKRGYVCLAIDYRVHSGSFPCTPQEECSLPQLQLAATDTDTAFDWIRANAATYHINTNWMFVAGGSAGGMVAVTWGLVDGTNAPATPEKVFNHSGLIAIGDLWGSPEEPKRWYIGTNNPNQYNLPPYHYLDTNDAPLVIIHGTADTTVPFQNSVDLTNELTQAGVGFEIHPIAGAGHTPTSYNADIEAWVANFFAQTWLNVLTPPAPPVTAPTALVQPATGVTASSATMNGSVNPNGGATTYYFRYGQTTSYGGYSATNTLSAGTSPVVVTGGLSGLLPGTPYHYQVMASNSAGTSSSADAAFTTPPTAPVAVTQPAVGVTPGGATVNGSVNPGGAATTWYFQYGPTTSYGSYTPTNSLPAGTSAVAVNAVLTGLFSGTPYHYQLVASNSAGTSPGGDAQLTTVAVPPPQLISPIVLLDGTVQFAFTSTPGASFTMLGASDPNLPVSSWTVLGPVTEVTPGEYQFTDLQATNNPLQFYLLRQP